MQFNEYLKQCRQENSLTQEQLAHELYTHDIENFHALDTSTLGKWERSVTKPKAAKQVSIIKYFQAKTGLVFPCLNNYNTNEAAGLICKTGMRNLIGKSKKHIYDFPSETMSLEDMHVYPLRTFDRMENLIDLNMPLHQSINHRSLQITKEQFREWALHPDALFVACEYKGSFLGFSFTIKLKPEIFNKILNFEMTRAEITTEDFASFDENGSSLMLGFFAANEETAVLLFIRYYAYLLSNQKYIEEVGAITNSEDAIKLISNMNLKYHSHHMTSDDVKIKTYRETLANVLASEYVVKMLLSRQNCPEE